MPLPPSHLEITPPRFEEPECDKNPEDFFSVDDPKSGHRAEGYRAARQREHRARRSCQRCPFLIECAMHGLEHEEFGVWGGLTERDRHLMGGVGRPTPGSQPTLRHTVGYLAEAGFTLDQIRSLFTEWRKRKPDTEEDDAGERGAA